MIEPLGLLTAVMTFSLIVASPGPATLAAATVSMRIGRKQGLQFGIGLSLGLAFWGVIAATGLGAILQASAIALMMMKVCGGVYLLWLAYGSFRSVRQSEQKPPPVDFDGNWFVRGLLLNISNPKAVVAWMAALSLGVSEGHQIAQVFTATGLCIAAAFIINATYAVLFSTHAAMQVYERCHKGINSMMGIVFTFAGLSFVRSAFAR